MMRLTILVFPLFCLFSSCNSDHVIKNKLSDNELRTVREQFNKIEVRYYVNYKKSPITKIYFPDTGQNSTLKFINFIEDSNSSDTCTLNANISDGNMDILKDSVTLLHLEFILEGNCKGFYSDLESKPKKYNISAEGVVELMKLKRKTEQ